MSDDLETVKTGFGLFNIVYLIVFFCVYWGRAIGSIMVWEIFMLWIYVVVIPCVVLGVIILILIVVN